MAWRSLFSWSRSPLGASTDLVEQQLTNQTLEAVEGFIGVAQNITKCIVDNPVLEGLTEFVEVVKLTSHESNDGLMSIDSCCRRSRWKSVR